MSTTKNIESCPNCGSVISEVAEVFKNEYAIYCKKCGYHLLGSYNTKFDAILAWNKIVSLTNEEAKMVIGSIIPGCSDLQVKALDMAIKALEKNENTNKDITVGDRVKFTRCKYDNEYGDIGTVIKLGLGDNINVLFDESGLIAMQKQDVTKIDSDLISRQIAIYKVAETICYYPNKLYENLNNYDNAKRLAEGALLSIPAELPLKCGNWIKGLDGEVFVCSECGIAPAFKGSIETLNYCPECGAYMKGEAK